MLIKEEILILVGTPWGDPAHTGLIRCAKVSELEANHEAHVDSIIAGIEENLEELFSERRNLEVSLQRSITSTHEAVASLRSRQSDGAPKTKTVKLEVAKYGGTEGENLLRWIVQVTTAANAQGIADEQLRFAFVMSHLKGRAEEWAFSLRVGDSDCFDDFEDVLAQLKTSFLPPNSDFRHRSKFMTATQAKRTFREFVDELRYLAACLTDGSSPPKKSASPYS
ncbi:Aste57867_20726 [Aphanomyces stellatus]|uniref:Aste57867_20726 protein n=1 Tax=Aphanomyces stellatus TaxID=120398 RepID=A0A485LFS6_9STRA|nr:hypothetical protein As57867_020658 [Aphanomyces stellatus]VFT97406.1 Aste57867_20726 [Aphanomyces stellatus]